MNKKLILILIVMLYLISNVSSLNVNTGYSQLSLVDEPFVLVTAPVNDTNETERMLNLLDTNCTAQVIASFYDNGTGICEADDGGSFTDTNASNCDDGEFLAGDNVCYNFALNAGIIANRSVLLENSTGRIMPKLRQDLDIKNSTINNISRLNFYDPTQVYNGSIYMSELGAMMIHLNISSLFSFTEIGGIGGIWDFIIRDIDSNNYLGISVVENGASDYTALDTNGLATTTSPIVFTGVRAGLQMVPTYGALHVNGDIGFNTDGQGIYFGANQDSSLYHLGAYSSWICNAVTSSDGCYISSGSLKTYDVASGIMREIIDTTGTDSERGYDGISGRNYFYFNDDVYLKKDLNVSKNITINSLASTYTNGEAYLCVDNNGTIFAKETACS